jgi:cell division septal protein FtsQ
MKLFSSKQSDLPRRRQDGVTPHGQSERRSVLEEGSEIFRRNRTLTGSVSSRVFSAANDSASHLKSTRVQAHELAEQRRRIGGALLVIIVAILCLTILAWQFTATLQVRTPGVQTPTGTAQYEKAIQEYYSQHPFERLRFALNQKQLTDYIAQTLPEVRTVAIKSGALPTASIAEISMRQPIAGWRIGSTQYYVDDQGVSFTSNYYPAPAVQIIDKSGVPLETGKAIASSRFLSYVGRTVGQSATRSLIVEQVVIPMNTTRQIELRLKGITYPVKLVIDRPVGEQVEDMARAVAFVTEKHVTPQYLDVRVSGKAFYK